MTAPALIGADWGTSHLRLYLYGDDDGLVSLESPRRGPGARAAAGQFEDILFDLAGDWLAQDPSLPICVSGMAGSSAGWCQAPYAACPADLDAILAASRQFDVRGHPACMIAGVSSPSPLGQPDTMRGEELQLLGLMHLGEDHGLITLPGTHNKWVLVDNGVIRSFMTTLTGELFGLLRDHSVLVNGVDSQDDHDAFESGMRSGASAEGSAFLHALFSTRGRQLAGELPPAHATSYLSGVVIGADVASARRLMDKHMGDGAPITVLAEPRLAERYTCALEAHGLTTKRVSLETVMRAGHELVFRRLWG